jgi:peroxidase
MNSLNLIALCCVMVVFGGLPLTSNAQLDPLFYVKTCPQLHTIVQDIIRNVTRQDPSMPPSLIRLHFHDCFVQVCIIFS